MSRITDGFHAHRHEGLQHLLQVALLRVVCGSGSILLVASDECPQGLNLLCSRIFLLIHEMPCVASLLCLSCSWLPHQSKHASAPIRSRGLAWLLFCCYLFPLPTLTSPPLVYISILPAVASHVSNPCTDMRDNFV